MKWMLDTNACIRYLNGRALKLKQRIDAASPNDLLVCSVVKAELFFGAAQSSSPTTTLQRQKEFLAHFASLAFDDMAADAYGPIRAELNARGTPIGPNDLLIASIAVVNGVTLVTHNVNEFGRVKGLIIEDWEA
jgi:tRNA(fMet)-specific endonuclease VapC